MQEDLRGARKSRQAGAQVERRILLARQCGCVSIHGQLIVLCHYALRVWNRSNRGSSHLFGLSHGRLPQVANALSMDVGVDTHDFRPWHFDEIKALMPAGIPDSCGRH